MVLSTIPIDENPWSFLPGLTAGREPSLPACEPGLPMGPPRADYPPARDGDGWVINQDPDWSSPTTFPHNNTSTGWWTESIQRLLCMESCNRYILYWWERERNGKQMSMLKTEFGDGDTSLWCDTCTVQYRIPSFLYHPPHLTIFMTLLLLLDIE